MKRAALGSRHAFIPDVQVKPGVPIHHLDWAAAYLADKRPEVIVMAGDWHDMPSLSSYDAGTRAAEGRRYADDIASGNDAAKRFDANLRRYGGRGWRPRKIITLGNHEDRIRRAANDNPYSHYSLDDLAWKRLGWEVIPFLQPIEIDGVLYCHYFPLGPNGRVVNSRNGAPSARAQAQRLMQSSVSGHRQGFDYAIMHTPVRTVKAIQAGSFYLHQEEYLTPQGNGHWHGIVFLNDAHKGNFSIMEIDMRYLEARYG